MKNEHATLRRPAVSAAKRGLAYLLCALTALPPATVLGAPPVPAGTTNTAVLPNGSGNGVPVVNIAAPNAAGLSHNKFNSYNVDAQGLILNNSTAAAVQSQLGGYILGNPNLGGKSAAIILNEVVQPNRSLLGGYQEVAGQAAQVVIANPYGITCAGCGFINAPRATLTTGTPNIDAAGNLVGFSVRQGDILINGNGLDATGQNYFDLVARSVVIQGQVNGTDLLVAAGANDFNYAGRSVTPIAGTGAAPSYAIDSSALGGMYVDRIRFIATEAGVGVRMLGNVGASVDDIQITAAGKLELANQMSAQRDVSIAYTGAAQASAIDIGGAAGPANVYAGRNFTLDGGAGGVALGAGNVGAGGNLSIAGASLGDTGTATDYRYADGGLSVSAAGALVLGAATYDAAGSLSLAAATADLGTATLNGRSAASGVAVSTSGDLAISGAAVLSPGSIVLNAGASNLSLGAAALVKSGADVTASFGTTFTNSGTILANNAITLSNAVQGASFGGPATSIDNAGAISAGGTLTIGSAPAGGTPTLDSFTTGAASQTLAGSLVMNAAAVTNSGYLQGDATSIAGGAALTNNAGATAVFGTAAGTSNALVLSRLLNYGTLYGAGNLQVDAIQIDNLGGDVIVEGSLTLNATRALAGGLTNTLKSTGALQANNLSASAASIVFRDAALSPANGSAYAANDLSLNATGTVTMGGDLYASHNLSVSAATLSDAVAGGSRAAGNNFTVTTANTLDLYSGQTYDAGGTLAIAAPRVNVATQDVVAAPSDTILTSGNAIQVNTDTLVLGSAAAAGSLQAASSVVLARKSSGLGLFVNNIAGHVSSIQSGGTISATGTDFYLGGTVVANGDITVRPDNGSTVNLNVTQGGWVQSGGTLSVRTGTASRGVVDVTVNAGGTLAGNQLDLVGNSLSVVGNVAGNADALLQGGTGGGRIDVTTLALPNARSKIIANAWSATTPVTTVDVGSAFSNSGLLYAQKDMQVTVKGGITNQASGSISSGFGSLVLQTDLSNYAAPYQITNYGTLYAAQNLSVLVPEAGTAYNAPGALVSSDGNLVLGQATMSGDFQGTVRNEGRIEATGDAEIRAHYFYNNAPLGGVVRNTSHFNQVTTYNANGDSGRYNDFAVGATVYSGWDHAHPPIVAAGAGDHVGRPNYGGSGVNYYHVIDIGNSLFRDFYTAWNEQDQYVNPGAVTPQINVNGTLTIKTFTGQNVAGSIYGGNLNVLNMYPGAPGSSFLNQSVDLYRYDLVTYGRSMYDCGNNHGSDVACVGIYGVNYIGDQYKAWTNGTPAPNWGADDLTPQQTAAYVVASRAATLAAPSGRFFTDIGSLTNQTATQAVNATNGPTGAPAATQTANVANPTPGQTQTSGPTPLVIGGISVTLPTGPNGIFVASTSPTSKYLIETNPLYASADNPYLGSDYLATKLGLDPDKLLLRLGDGNYEARLIRDQLVAQTGSALLRTAYDTYDQQKQLMDNASLEAKELKLNFGAALTAEQVASLKHDIVWMVEQVVQGKKVLVPVVYLSSATRAEVSGASIVADTAIVTGDSFLNRGGTVRGSTNLVVVTRKDIVNSSGELSGGNVQLQSLEGDIINRTETFRSGDVNNYVTTAGRSGGIYASNSLFMKSGRDINVEGAQVYSAGDATVVAGRNVNVSALVLDSRKTSIENKSGMFNRDVSITVETQQTAQNASISAKGDVTVAAGKDVNLTGAYVGSEKGAATLISDKGNVNINALALTNTKAENTQHIGFFAETQAGKKEQAKDADKPNGLAQADQNRLTVLSQAGSAGRTNTADSRLGGDKKQPDPTTTSASAFTGLAIESTTANSSATGNYGSLVDGNAVNIIAKSGNVNIQGSQVNSGEGGTFVDAAKDVNITAAYDRSTSTRREESHRIGVAAEANADGAYAGLKSSGRTLDSNVSSRTAATSSLGSKGDITIRAGGKLTNEGTQFDAGRDINIVATEVENRAARNEVNSDVKSSSYEASVMAGVTTGGMGQSIANLAQGTGKELTIAAPESQIRLQASGSSSEDKTRSNDAVVTGMKAGGSINYQVKGKISDEGTSYDAKRDINIDAGSYENRAAANLLESSSKSTSGGGTATLGVDATRSINARVNVSGSSQESAEKSSTAVVGSLKAGGNVNLRTRGDTTLEGTKLEAGKDVNVDAKGNLNLLQANNRIVKDEKSSEGSANVSASLCADLSCASGGAGASARTTSLNENSTVGVAGSIASGGNVNLRSGNNLTLQGTNIASKGDTTLEAKGNVDFQALTSTIQRKSSADGAGIDAGLNVGASGKLASDGGGNASVNFERGRETLAGTLREGGSVSSGGTFTLRSGGNSRLEGTTVNAASANVDVKGNFTMESAQSTVQQDKTSFNVALQASGGKQSEGGRNFGGAVSLDVGVQKKDNVLNSNASLNTTGGTRLNVGGDATLAGANINAGGGVSGEIKGNLAVETRADRIKEEDTGVKAYAGVGNMQLSGKGAGAQTRAQKIDAAQDKFGNVANQAMGTGIFLDVKSEKKDNLVVTQQSGISGGTGGLGGLTVGGNADFKGATAETQGVNVKGSVTTSEVQTRREESSTNFSVRGTVASALGSDQGSGGTFSNVFQASGGNRNKPGGFEPGATPQGPRRGASQGAPEIGAQRRGPAAPADTPAVTGRTRSGAVSADAAPSRVPQSRPTQDAAAAPRPVGRVPALEGGLDGVRRQAGDAPRELGPVANRQGPDVVLQGPEGRRPSVGNEAAHVVQQSRGAGLGEDAGRTRIAAIEPRVGRQPADPVRTPEVAPGTRESGPARPAQETTKPAAEIAKPASEPAKPAATGGVPARHPELGGLKPEVAAHLKPLPAGADGRPVYVNQENGLKLKGVAREYYGEDHGKSARWGDKGDAREQVRYLSEAERGSRELEIRDGLLVHKATGKPFDTGDKTTGAIFVIDAQGRIYASAEDAVGRFHHSSFTGGEPVAMAGHIIVQDGKLLHVNNNSGHYQPDREQMVQTSELFKAHKLDMSQTRWIEVVPGQSGGPAQFRDVIGGNLLPPGTHPMQADVERAVNQRLGTKGVHQIDTVGGRPVYVNPEVELNGKPLVLKGISPDYEGEQYAQAKANDLAHPDWAAKGGVKYLTPAERDARELVVNKDGLLVNKLTGQPFSTGAKGDGAIFVIDAHGRMYASTENEQGKFHHSSFTGGEPVAGAGHIVVQDGRLLHINNNSGHYQPDTAMLQQSLDVMKASGVDVSHTAVVVYQQDPSDGKFKFRDPRFGFLDPTVHPMQFDVNRAAQIMHTGVDPEFPPAPSVAPAPASAPTQPGTTPAPTGSAPDAAPAKPGPVSFRWAPANSEQWSLAA